MYIQSLAMWGRTQPYNNFVIFLPNFRFLKAAVFSNIILKLFLIQCSVLENFTFASNEIDKIKGIVCDALLEFTDSRIV